MASCPLTDESTLSRLRVCTARLAPSELAAARSLASGLDGLLQYSDILFGVVVETLLPERGKALAKTRRVYSFFIFCFHLFSKQPFRSSRYLSTFSRSIESDRCKPFDAETSVSFEIHHKSRGYVDDTWKMLYVYMFEKIFRVVHTIPAARLSCPSCPFRPTSQPLRTASAACLTNL